MSGFDFSQGAENDLALGSLKNVKKQETPVSESDK